jgi:hypothetical protein
MKKQCKKDDKSAKLQGLLKNTSDDQTENSENGNNVSDAKQIMKNFLIQMKEEIQKES